MREHVLVIVTFVFMGAAAMFAVAVGPRRKGGKHHGG